MNIIIHRGAKEVGGSCVEVSSNGTTLLLDFGLPLSFEFGDDTSSVLPEPLYSDIVKGEKKIDALLVSHAHLDHYGLIGRLPKETPLFMGEATSTLIRFSDEFTPAKIGLINSITFKAHEPFRIGSFEIIPYLMDHSAFDSYAFLIKSDTKSIFYSGDFRGHGHKHEQFDNLISNSPKVDVLLMEGTLIGDRLAEQVITEAEIEKQMADLCRETKGAVFVTVPSQNIDRIISIYRAAKQTGRKFIIDLYSAELFSRLEKFSDDIPQPSDPDVLLWFPWIQRENLINNRLGSVMKNHEKWKKPLKDFSSDIPHSVMMLRPPFRKEIQNNADLSDSVWVYSMWKGYLERSEPLQNLKQWTEDNEIPLKFRHTTGHAQIEDLKRLARALSPQVLIPIHSYHRELFLDYFGNVHSLEDGEKFEV